MTAEELFHRHRVVPVVVLKTLDETVPKLAALQAGGIHIAEITFRTPCAPEALRLAAARFPDMTLGAGTVLSASHARQALEAGADFVVSPGLSVSVAEVCGIDGVPYIPGCVTPTEIMTALSMKLQVLKFFPASVYGGPAALRALSAPFPCVRFLPTGGVDWKNIGDYLSLDCVAAVGGSFMLQGDIAENCRRLSPWL